MNNAGNLCKALLGVSWRCPSIQIEKFHSAFNLRRKNLSFEKYFENENIQSSLWFTNLPSRRKRILTLADKKKLKLKKKSMPFGNLLISCKRSEFNHYSGNQYGKFDVIPLASKAWHHRKSKGDHFTILPTTEHPAFLVSRSENVPITFEEAGLFREVIEQLGKLNVENPTTIQAKSIPAILQGNSVLIAAETGCGKTLAYLAPIAHNILNLKKNIICSEVNAPFAVILVPTRELAIQVGMIAHRLCSDLGITTLALLGGKTKKMLLNPIKEIVDVLICTPGVFSKMLTHHMYSMQLCKYLVLDEADTLLDDSFNEKLRHIIHKSKLKFGQSELIDVEKSQLCLVSATKPKSLDTILENIIPRENLVEISTNYLHKIQSHIPQEFIRVGIKEKPEELLKIVKRNVKELVPTMIFSNKTVTSNWLNHFLNENGIRSIRVNALMNQEQRLEQYQLFREGSVNVISCTDIASRGLDCTRVKHVINYEFPRFVADYIHRSGRTGRIGYESNCLVTSLISHRKELPLLHAIEKAARTSLLLENVNNNIARILRNRMQNAAKSS